MSIGSIGGGSPYTSVLKPEEVAPKIPQTEPDQTDKQASVNPITTKKEEDPYEVDVKVQSNSNKPQEGILGTESCDTCTCTCGSCDTCTCGDAC